MFNSVQGAKEGVLGHVCASTPIQCRLHLSKGKYRKDILVADEDMDMEFLFSMAKVRPDIEPGSFGYWRKVGLEISVVLSKLRKLHPLPKGAWFCVSPSLGLGAEGQRYVPWICIAYNGKYADHISMSCRLHRLYKNRSWEEIMKLLEMSNVSSK